MYQTVDSTSSLVLRVSPLVLNTPQSQVPFASFKVVVPLCQRNGVSTKPPHIHGDGQLTVSLSHASYLSCLISVSFLATQVLLHMLPRSFPVLIRKRFPRCQGHLETKISGWPFQVGGGMFKLPGHIQSENTKKKERN